jgi:glycosyltransferase involved in cell wall biosynthesis
LLRDKRPSVRLSIVGADPSAAILRLGDLPGVTVTGSVPDVRPHVTRAALTVAPLRIARGTQNKILEAMAMGVPVVCSTVASGGVDAVPDEHLLTADTPEDTAAAILHVLENATERDRLARTGRERVLSHHAWPSSMRRLDAIIERCVTAFQTPSHLSLQSP